LGCGLDPWTVPQADSLAPGDFWRNLLVIGDAPASQFDILHDMLRREPHIGPVACLALTGSGFHGHRGRNWAAETGNIHLSVGLPVNLQADATLPLLIMLPAVAVVDAVRAVTAGRVEPGIKWVNDILVEGRKIAGVLTTTQTRGRLVEAVTLGIGLNVSSAPRVAPTPFVPRTGALHEFGGEEKPPFSSVLQHLLGALGRRHRELLAGGGVSLLRAYRESSLVLGRRVMVWDECEGERGAEEHWPPPRAAGRVLSIEADLTLRMEGRDEPVTGGRLAFETSATRPGIRK
jgi:BirA family biotin operon repressor/biotin-[acetyl-CoA-carboxylase] ligase